MSFKFWTKALRETERELETATKPSKCQAVATNLQRAKAELKRLDHETKPKRPKRS
jgi:ABC-type Zn uptake system ZnuABC Zn-binding protein ZnuA